jgi:hypothetical protein
MPLGNWNLQWLNHNSQRSYPLTDWGSAADQTATIKVPDSFILALYFPVHAGMDVSPDKFYLQSLGIFSTGYNIAIGYNDGSNNPPQVASVNIAHASHTEYRSYAFPGVDNFDDSVGKLVIGKLDEVQNLPVGLYKFDPAATPLETDCIRPMIRGISSLTVVNGSDRSDRIYGDVELVAGNNFRIVANRVGNNPPQIVFSAIDGEGLNEDCACDEASTGPAIRFVNGIPPLPDGNFRIVGNKCMDVQPIANGLRFSDLCSEPCCGCEELDALTRQIDRFADGVATLQNFSSNLGSEVTQMSQIVLGSRLADSQGCIEC